MLKRESRIAALFLSFEEFYHMKNLSKTNFFYIIHICSPHVSIFVQREKHLIRKLQIKDL